MLKKGFGSTSTMDEGKKLIKQLKVKHKDLEEFVPQLKEALQQLKDLLHQEKLTKNAPRIKSFKRSNPNSISTPEASSLDHLK